MFILAGEGIVPLKPLKQRHRALSLSAGADRTEGTLHTVLDDTPSAKAKRQLWTFAVWSNPVHGAAAKTHN